MSIKEKIIYGISIINVVFMIIIILISTILITLWKIL
ncbi:putative membrane protein, partial [Chlamydia psittaci 02DC14]